MRRPIGPLNESLCSDECSYDLGPVGSGLISRGTQTRFRTTVPTVSSSLHLTTGTVSTGNSVRYPSHSLSLPISPSYPHRPVSWYAQTDNH